MDAGALIHSRYRLIAPLGAGASGSVWAAKNELIDREVALKMMSPEVARDAVSLQRFFNEARASGRVRSPSIVEILDLGQAENGSPFLVFERLHGESVDARLKRTGVIETEELVSYCLDVARALAAAHAQGIIHRDLKPGNIFLHKQSSGETVAKVLDFGISKFFDQAHSPTLTRTGTVVGSPTYMSPEQAAGEEDIDGRTDIWSLGVVMYEALTGAPPHEAANYNALMLRILTHEVSPIGSRKTDLPESVASIVDTCLRQKRADRYANAEELVSALERALRELRAVRYRASGGRRASDRVDHASRNRRRSTDFGRQRSLSISKSVLLGFGVALGFLSSAVFLLLH